MVLATFDYILHNVIKVQDNKAKLPPNIITSAYNKMVYRPNSRLPYTIP